MNQNFFIILSVSLIVLGIACQIMIGVLIQNMINETDNMTATDNKLLKQCKLKFMNCYRMNGGVNNVQIFTDKFVNRLKIGRISLVTLGHLSGQMVLLAVFAAGTGIYFGITGGESVIGLLPFYIVSFLGLYLYFSVSSAVDIPGKKKILKTNLVDYFENHMISRLGTVPDSIRELEEKERGNRSGRQKDSRKSEIDEQFVLDEPHQLRGQMKKGVKKRQQQEDLEEEEEISHLLLQSKEELKTAGSSRVISGGSRDSARQRARSKELLPEEKESVSDSWQDVLRDNLSDEEIQALLTEFLA